MSYRSDMMYFRPWGSKGNYQEFPYAINGVNSLPENDPSLNDVDLDSYTNTKGYTIRNRIRHDVYSVDFNVSAMTGEEFHNLLERTKNVWLDCYFFSESDWAFVSKKLYRSATIKFHRYYIDPVNPNKNIYTDIQFSFVEQ